MFSNEEFEILQSIEESHMNLRIYCAAWRFRASDNTAKVDE